MSSNIISSVFQFETPLQFESKQAAEQRMFDLLAAYRPAFQSLPMGQQQKYNATFYPRIRWSEDPSGSLVLQDSLEAPIEIELLGTPSAITGLRAFGHHGIGDGIAFLPIVARLADPTSAAPRQTLPAPAAKPRPLAWTSEFQCFVLYLAFLVKLCFSAKTTLGGSSYTTTMKTLPLHKTKGETFTCSILERLYPGLRQALNKDTITYCVPAMTESPATRGFSLPRNSFVPVLLPWGPESNALSHLFLHSKAVRWISWVLVQCIAFTEFTWLRDLMMNRVDCVVSSIYISDQPISVLQSFHFHAPTPQPIPFTASLSTIGQKIHATLVSRHPDVPAVKLMKHLQS
jgi:hypothetical protein